MFVGLDNEQQHFYQTLESKLIIGKLFLEQSFFTRAYISPC